MLAVTSCLGLASAAFTAPTLLQPSAVAPRASPVVASAHFADRRSLLAGAFSAAVFASSPLAAVAQVESVNVIEPFCTRTARARCACTRLRTTIAAAARVLTSPRSLTLALSCSLSLLYENRV